MLRASSWTSSKQLLQIQTFEKYNGYISAKAKID
jgi:hypothetical protein